VARLEVANRGDRLQVWRVTANILNKQRGQPARGGIPARGFGVGL
jgi:hypothetical protein